jgi:hypothetical protein
LVSIKLYLILKSIKKGKQYRFPFLLYKPNYLFNQ